MMSKEKVCDLLAKTNLVLFRELSNRYRGKDINITPVQAKVLMTIRDNDKCNQKDVEKVICCNKSTLSSILDTMEKNGLIKRVEDSNDYRKKILQLTEGAINDITCIEKELDYLELQMRNILREKYDLFCDCLNRIYSDLKEENK